MPIGELRSKIDGVWNAFWVGGIANPLMAIVQIGRRGCQTSRACDSFALTR
jgi:hypothetical protein